MGDFNAVYDRLQRKGGNPIGDREMDDFINCMNDSNLSPLNSLEAFFSWSNNNSNKQGLVVGLIMHLVIMIS